MPFSIISQLSSDVRVKNTEKPKGINEIRIFDPIGIICAKLIKVNIGKTNIKPIIIKLRHVS
ncbi:MAG: hypothetical protein LBU74_02625 [Methanobacteriaceae archaeon]|jgi:hypothetical protein|nr:hypothetical protein [Candidatus Methanorudis spinitermitis]